MRARGKKLHTDGIVRRGHTPRPVVIARARAHSPKPAHGHAGYRAPRRASSRIAGVARFVIGSPVLLVLVLAFGVLPFAAFEAHVVNVTADIVQIDPPVITPPGGQYSAPVNINISDSDPDATHIFYTLTAGTDAGSAPNPSCGGLLGGPKPRGPIAITDDTVVKAIACDGGTASAHGSLITTEIYDLTLDGKIQGHKYHDLDQSGTLTTGDIPLEGWRIDLKQGSTIVDTTVTDVNGYYIFNNVSPGTYTVLEESRDGWVHVTQNNPSVTIDGSETETVDFYNFDTGFACVPVDINFPANLAVQAAGSSTLSDNDDVAIASNVTVNGDVRSNDELEKVGGGSNRTVNGNVTVTNTVESGFTITGITTTGAATASLPDAQIATWILRAQDGGTVNGSFVFPNNTVGLSLGPTEILGNLTFGSSNGATIKGPIYVHGDLSIGSNTTITQDPAFGNQFTTIIVDGVIEINSNITFNGAGTTGTFLLVSTHAAVSGNDAAILTNSNNSDLGDVVLYTSNGDIHINSNRTLLAAFAAHGTGADSNGNAAIRFDSNVTVNYRTLPNKVSCGPRQPFETSSHVLINEFLPNPNGSDTGAAGLPHDGEWVELFNPTASTVDVAGHILYDNNNTHALPITTANTSTGGTTIPSPGYLVVYRDGDTDFELNNSGGDSVRLFTAAIGSGGVLVDSHTYTRDAPDNKSFARIPDGASNWIDPEPTPGEPNDFFLVPLEAPAPPAESGDTADTQAEKSAVDEGTPDDTNEPTPRLPQNIDKEPQAD